MSKNPDFLEQVSSLFGRSDDIIVGCQSGGRSFIATTDLLDAGFTAVKDVTGGYTAWAQNGLPTQD
ncbi:PREDICTED: thiosulfate sulfurtransferase 16, chloroplastic [Camelina sativa]|uniref:Thiosulfate sulfurtransferase 16, chloroplastic n=1 Tax=Camelina sativa TaxID=90675 RepID=A0ABM0XEF1_CAMSA|nr:PREDICTED: thiosulfate sulfurtransferase 16, chloroplastic [Camelina sativa]